MKKLQYGLLALVVVAGAVALRADSVVEEIIARINNDIITRSEFDRSRVQLKDELKQQAGPNADAEFAKREPDILRDLIDQDLLLQKGKDLGINVDNDVIKKLDDIRKQMHLESMEELEKAAEAQGVSYEDFKSNLRNQLITEKVISQEVGSKIQITHDEEQKFYNEHRAQLEQPEQVRLSEILIAIQKPGADPSGNQLPDEQAIAAAQARAQEVLQKIRAGAAFEEVAKSNSDGPTADQGGDLGFFKRGMLAKELEDLTFGMKQGAVSDVVRTKQGFVILKVTEHNEAGLPPLKDVEPRLQEAIYYQKLQPALRDYLTKLREEAYIDIKQGYVDSGASPNQTKPVITTASAADEQAKKKKKKKFGIF